MEFVRFLNNRQQEVFSKQSDDRYSAWADGEVHAILSVLWVYRLFFRLVAIPKVIFHYFLVQTHFAFEPRPAVDEKAAADKRLMDKVAKDLKVGKGAGGRLDS